MKIRHLAAAGLAITLLSGSLICATTFPARADDDSQACMRRDALAEHIAGGLYVPENVLEMAKRHCAKNVKGDENIDFALTDDEVPESNVPDPCHELNGPDRRRYEGQCIVYWLAFWNKNGDRPMQCIDYLNAKLQNQGNVASLEQACQEAEKDHGLPTWAALIIIVVVLGFIGWALSKVFGGGDQNPPHHHVVNPNAGRPGW